MIDESATLPPWAVKAFIALFFMVVSAAVWGLKTLGGRVTDEVKEIKKSNENNAVVLGAKIDQVDCKVQGLDRRMVRIETLAEKNDNGSSCRFPRAHTPPPIEG